MKLKDKGHNNKIVGLEGEITNLSILFRGSNNNIEFESGKVSFCSKKPTKIIITGDNNYMLVDGGCKLGGEFHIADGSGIVIRNHTKIVDGRFFALERQTITIGSKCLISQNVTIKTSDHHSILDNEGNRINKAGSVRIGNETWLCEGSTILKGVSISNGCIVGHSSLVTKSLKQERSIYAGVPAKLLRGNVKWTEELI